MSDNMRVMTVRYTNGTAHKFAFPAVSEDKFNVAARIQELLNQKQLLLELGGRLIIIPFENVQMIELNPAPDKIPPNAIKNAKLVK